MSGRSGGSAGSAPPAHELLLDALYDRKRDNKSVRVLTVIIYVFCVSLAAIMLSLYYVFFWEPKDAHSTQRKVAHTVDQQTSTTPMPTCLMPHTGGSNTTVSDAELAANITVSPYEVSSSYEHSPSPLPDTSDQPSTTDVIAPSSNEPNDTNVT